MKKNEDGRLAGVLIGNYEKQLMELLYELKLGLGPEYWSRRINRRGISETYCPILEDLFRLARQMRRDGRKLVDGADRSCRFKHEVGLSSSDVYVETDALGEVQQIVWENNEGDAETAVVEDASGVRSRWWKKLKGKTGG